MWPRNYLHLPVQDFGFARVHFKKGYRQTDYCRISRSTGDLYLSGPRITWILRGERFRLRNSHTWKHRFVRERYIPWLGKEPLSDWLTDGGKRQRSGGGQVEDDLTYQQHLMAFNSAIVKVMNRVTDSFLQYLPRGNYHSKYILPIELFLNFLSRFTFFRLNFTYPNLRT